MDVETVWVEKKYVRPRLSPDEVWLIYRVPFKETERLLEAGGVHAYTHTQELGGQIKTLAGATRFLLV